MEPNSAKDSDMLFCEQFNASDADIIYCSSDDVHFRIHSCNVKLISGCLLPLDFTPDDKVVYLTEESSTLELMFQFMYPRRQPNVQDLDFQSLSKLAEAVEKYEIYSAMQVCNMVMAIAIPDHAIEVLDYSVKHDYPMLSNRAAPLITLVDMSKLSDSVSSETIRAWLRYYNRWRAQIKQAIIPPVHNNCIYWPTCVKDILTALLADTDTPNTDTISSLIAFHSVPAYECCKGVAKSWQGGVRQRLIGLPQFTDFL